MARAVCRAAWRARTRCAALQPVAAALSLPGVRAPDLDAGKHPAAIVVVAARALLGLRHADQRTLPRGGAAGRIVVGGSCLEVGRDPADRGGAAAGMDVDRPRVHRPRHHPAARQPDPAAAMARPAVQSGRTFCQPAGCGHRRHGRLSRAVVGVLAVQAGHRQGGHGLWRLQATGGHWGLAGLADAARHLAAVVSGRRDDRRGNGRPGQARSACADPLRPVSRRGCVGGAVLRRGPDTGLPRSILMFTVGLTGGIGSGKSTVAECFASHGVPVIDTDVIARDLTVPGGAVLAQIRAVFGDAVIQADGTLERAALRRCVFADPAARRRLEAILHPQIRRVVKETLATLDAPYALIVIPLLVETGGYRDLLNRVLVVDCPEDMQIARVMTRNGLARDEAMAILAAQARRADRLAVADDVIVNTASPETLRDEVAALHQRYQALSRKALP